MEDARGRMMPGQQRLLNRSERTKSFENGKLQNIPKIKDPPVRSRPLTARGAWGLRRLSV